MGAVKDISMKLVVVFGLVAIIALSNGAALDDYEDELREEEANYLRQLDNYLRNDERLEKSKRGRFCLSRDLTCPNFEKGRDLCCKGSQCACNIFGQNCRCSSLGLFARLGRR